MQSFISHRKVPLPTGVTVHDKLTRRFSVKEREGTQFLGIDENMLLFAIPNTTERGEEVTFKFVSMRDYGLLDVKKLSFIGKAHNHYVFMEVA